MKKVKISVVFRKFTKDFIKKSGFDKSYDLGGLLVWKKKNENKYNIYIDETCNMREIIFLLFHEMTHMILVLFSGDKPKKMSNDEFEKGSKRKHITLDIEEKISDGVGDAALKVFDKYLIKGEKNEKNKKEKS